MGQKVNPIGQRLKLNRNWRSRWYANKRQFGSQLVEDASIREWILKQSTARGISDVTIRRMADRLEVLVRTARPGLFIGPKGKNIDEMREKISRKYGHEVWIEVEEVKRPDLEASLVAQNIADQLVRRIPFRRAMKRAIQTSREAGALGVKVQVSGRLGGADIARTEWYIEGSIPLHTLRANIDYAHKEAATSYGIIGVKVWIYTGEEQAQKVGA